MRGGRNIINNLNNRDMDMTWFIKVDIESPWFKVKITQSDKWRWIAKRLGRKAVINCILPTGKWCLIVRNRKGIILHKYYTKKNNAIRAARRELLR